MDGKQKVGTRDGGNGVGGCGAQCNVVLGEVDVVTMQQNYSTARPLDGSAPALAINVQYGGPLAECGAARQ